MLIVTTRFSKKKAVLAVLLLGALLAAIILIVGHFTGTEGSELPQLTDNAQRVAYLQSLGWEVEAEPLETLQFLLPSQLAEPYLSYNQLQKAQGFDLSACCGKQVARFTYAVTNYPGRPEGVQLNLYVCEEIPVAGDVCCPGADGFQDGLAFPQESGKYSQGT